MRPLQGGPIDSASRPSLRAQRTTPQAGPPRVGPGERGGTDSREGSPEVAPRGWASASLRGGTPLERGDQPFDVGAPPGSRASLQPAACWFSWAWVANDAPQGHVYASAMVEWTLESAQVHQCLDGPPAWRYAETPPSEALGVEVVYRVEGPGVALRIEDVSRAVGRVPRRRSKVVRVHLPEYALDPELDFVRLGGRVARVIEASLPNGRYVLRVVGVDDPPGMTIGGSTRIVLRRGTDKYDPHPIPD